MHTIPLFYNDKPNNFSNFKLKNSKHKNIQIGTDNKLKGMCLI